MSVTLATFIDRFASDVASARHLLAKGREHVAETGGDPDAMLNWRLADDMHPLAFQLSVVADFSRQWAARAADVPVPERTDWQAADLAALDQALADAATFLAGIDRAAVDARADTVLTVQITDSMAPTMPVGRWLSGFAATNISFHLNMTYALLRANGVKLGKLDLFSGGL